MNICGRDVLLMHRLQSAVILDRAAYGRQGMDGAWEITRKVDSQSRRRYLEDQPSNRRAYCFADGGFLPATVSSSL